MFELSQIQTLSSIRAVLQYPDSNNVFLTANKTLRIKWWLSAADNPECLVEWVLIVWGLWKHSLFHDNSSCFHLIYYADVFTSPVNGHLKLISLVSADWGDLLVSSLGLCITVFLTSIYIWNNLITIFMFCYQ